MARIIKTIAAVATPVCAAYRTPAGDIHVAEILLWALTENASGMSDIVGVSFQSFVDDDPGFVGYARNYEHALALYGKKPDVG